MREYRRAIWLDDEIENFTVDMGYLALNEIIIYPAHTLTEMHTILLSEPDIDVLIIDKNLNGKEDGEQMLENFRIVYPEIGALIYSNFVTTTPASKINPIGKLEKIASVTRRLTEKHLVYAIRNAYEFRPSQIVRTREYNRWQNAMSATWDFLHSVLILTIKPLVLLSVTIIAILQSVPVLKDNNRDMALVLFKNLQVMVPLLLAICLCWMFYYWRCPKRAKGSSSLNEYESKWEREYVLNPQIALNIAKDLGRDTYSSNNKQESATINVNMLFYKEVFDRPVSRYILACGLLASLLLYFFAVLNGFIDARDLFA